MKCKEEPRDKSSMAVDIAVEPGVGTSDEHQTYDADLSGRTQSWPERIDYQPANRETKVQQTSMATSATHETIPRTLCRAV
jgi:hypothetical protein